MLGRPTSLSLILTPRLTYGSGTPGLRAPVPHHSSDEQTDSAENYAIVCQMLADGRLCRATHPEKDSNISTLPVYRGHLSRGAIGPLSITVQTNGPGNNVGLATRFCTLARSQMNRLKPCPESARAKRT